MKSVWVKNLKTDEEKQRFQGTVISSRPVLARLDQLLDEEEATIDRGELSLKAYDTPNWSELQAHKNGKREMIRIIKNIINLDQQKDN